MDNRVPEYPLFRDQILRFLTFLSFTVDMMGNSSPLMTYVGFVTACF
jgi:hypothetical protein